MSFLITVIFLLRPLLVLILFLFISLTLSLYTICRSSFYNFLIISKYYLFTHFHSISSLHVSLKSCNYYFFILTNYCAKFMKLHLYCTESILLTITKTLKNQKHSNSDISSKHQDKQTQNITELFIETEVLA